MKTFPIIFACDSNYLDQTSVALFSLCKYCKTPDVSYKIYYLNTDFELSHKKHLIDIVRSSNNDQVSIEFVNLENLDPNYFSLNIDYISVSTYFRLLIPIIFRTFDKILYLDSDMVFAKDPFTLDSLDLGDNSIAGVKDKWVEYLCKPEVCNAENYENKFLMDNFGVKNMPDYIKQVLHINDYNKYINAGVIFFNLKRIREVGGELEFIKRVLELKNPLYQDQCICNSVGNDLGGIYILDDCFNTKFTGQKWIAEYLHESDPVKIQELLDQDYILNSLNSEEDIVNYCNNLPNFEMFIHYISQYKPWNFKFNYSNQVWWGAVFAMKNKDYYIDKYSKGYEPKLVKVYEYISNHFYK